MSNVNLNRSGDQNREGISENGFTLVETMLVLFFIIVILSVLPPFFLTTTEKMETEQFLYQLQADLYVA
ncbi:type II secretion system protein [Fervidibacillus albus]|uniref:Type II secretion system GspH family protein n=1 Tax=Fervidibacillus albus TaxID=2980026 RepID=A0A9E8LVW4_9BACI|nr:type II secretion system protein [Fervidibacillus albus]WAA10432.1 type II secretion system GspH family protein [Fervidibacillus albus]